MIRKALQTDITSISALLNECAEHMHSLGMTHWLNVYNHEVVSQSIANKEVFLLEQNNCLIGTIALSQDKPDYYLSCWPEAPKADYYISQLAVAPHQQRKGYGRTLLQYCMNLVMNVEIQLDAVAYHHSLQAFYQSLGFRIIAEGVGLGNKRYLLAYTESNLSN